MKWVRYIGALIILMCCINQILYADNNKQSYYRSFWNPKFHGKRLDYCSADKKLCGTEIANHYCQILGYDTSSKATIAYNVGVTNYLNACTGCKGWQCNGFTTINCVARTRHIPAKDYYFRSRTFVYPRFEHYRIDWCYRNGQGCGKRAAFSFCRRMGYERELGYKQDTQIEATRALGNHRLCFGEACRGFKQITCYR